MARSVARRLAATTCSLASGPMLAGCGALDRGFLLPAGPVASATRDEFLFVCPVMLFVIVPVLLLAPLIAWHYRLANTRRACRPQWSFSRSLEGMIWILPTATVTILAVFLWRDTHRLDPHRPLPGEAVTVQATARGTLAVPFNLRRRMT